jgi:hypothetical protein
VRLAVAVATATLLAACVSHGPARPAPAEPALRLWTPGVVRWSGERRVLGLTVENGSDRSVEVEEPDPRHAGVVLYTGPNDDRACVRDPAPGPATGAPVKLAPGEARELQVDLGDACSLIPPGEYRFEVVYEAPPAGAGPPVRLLPRYGQVVVEAPPRSLDRGGLGAGGSAPEGGSGSPGSGRRSR